MKNQKLKPPGHLSDESKKLWKSITNDYSIDESAGMILRMTLEAKDLHELARATIAKEGSVIKDRWGQSKPHPSCAILRDAATVMGRGFRLLGMDLAPKG
jgi:phage terminase small subunit